MPWIRKENPHTAIQSGEHDITDRPPLDSKKKMFYPFELNEGMDADLLFYISLFSKSIQLCYTDECLHENVLRASKRGWIPIFIQKKRGRSEQGRMNLPLSFFFFLSSSSPLCVGGLLCISVTCLGRRRVIEEGVTKPGRWFFPSLNERIREHLFFFFLLVPLHHCV